MAKKKTATKKKATTTKSKAASKSKSKPTAAASKPAARVGTKPAVHANGAKDKSKPAAAKPAKVATNGAAAAAKVIKPVVKTAAKVAQPIKPPLILGKNGGVTVANLQVHGGTMSIAEWLGRPDREPLTEAELRKVKTGLTKKDLDQYRQLLLEKRAEILGDVASMQTDAKTQSATVSYEHMADTGSDNYEQEFTLGLVESERRLLALIDDALLRMQNGYYGVCVETGQPINRPRLDAKPWAKFCIEVAREKERRGEM